MKVFKYTLWMIFAGLTAASLVACSSTNNNAGSKAPSTSKQAPQAQDAATPAEAPKK